MSGINITWKPQPIVTPPFFSLIPLLLIPPSIFYPTPTTPHLLPCCDPEQRAPIVASVITIRTESLACLWYGNDASCTPSSPSKPPNPPSILKQHVTARHVQSIPSPLTCPPTHQIISLMNIKQGTCQQLIVITAIFILFFFLTRVTGGLKGWRVTERAMEDVVDVCVGEWWSDSEEGWKFRDGAGGGGLSEEFNLSFCHMTSELSALPIQLLITLVRHH